jgi:hypothetical protein
MVDCPDDVNDPPAGSFDRIIAELEAVNSRFAAEAEQNRAKQEAIEDPPDRLRRLYDVPDEEFLPEPVLLVPFSETGVERPLPRRSDDAPPPLESHSVTISQDSISPGDTPTVTCTLRNFGGRAARNTYVEVFVDHKPATATVDRNPESGRVEIARPGPDQTLEVSGVTTLPPESELAVVMYADLKNMPPEDQKENILYLIQDIPVSKEREFEVTVAGHEVATGREELYDDQPDFKLRVYDTREISLHENFRDVPVLRETKGGFADSPNNQKRDADLAGRLSDPTVTDIGKTHTFVPPNGSATVSIETDDIQATAVENPILSVFYVRAYTIASYDTPDDWDDLDHTTSRFVGRTEAPVQVD